LAEAANAVDRIMPDGARLEHKLASVALHWRGLPDDVAAALSAQASGIWERDAAQNKLEILAFDGGLELRAIGCNKQYAVKAVLSETAQGSAIAYLGDDLTDEDAFRAVKTHGLGVLVRAEFRETAADVWLRPPDELVSFMQHWRVKSPQA
jgi:trehalose-phosphatase